MNSTSPATVIILVFLVLAVVAAAVVIEMARRDEEHQIEGSGPPFQGTSDQDATTGPGPSSTHPFVEPVSGQAVFLHMGAAPGVEHPDCIYRAEVSPDLDCFYCAHCGWNGRISGSWFMDLLSQEDA